MSQWLSKQIQVTDIVVQYSLNNNRRLVVTNNTILTSLILRSRLEFTDLIVKIFILHLVDLLQNVETFAGITGISHFSTVDVALSRYYQKLNCWLKLLTYLHCRTRAFAITFMCKKKCVFLCVCVTCLFIRRDKINWKFS